MATEKRDKLLLIGFLLGAALLLFLGRDLARGSALVGWGLTFGATSGAAVLLVALYRLRLELRASRLELARKEAELNFAREVQNALFPRRFPCDGGLEFSAICIPARGISGDFYDVMQLPDGRLIFAIADISGKGISAAILMANLQAGLRTLAQNYASPCEVCRQLNHHLHQVTDASKFATFFYAEWCPHNRRLRYINAGHHPPIVMGTHRGRKFSEGGFPLGMFPDTELQMGEAYLAPGDLLLLYSDGITEAASRGGEEFGAQRLEVLVEAHNGGPLGELQQRVLEAVRDWSGSEQEDDCTLLIIRAAEVREEGR